MLRKKHKNNDYTSKFIRKNLILFDLYTKNLLLQFLQKKKKKNFQ